MRKKIAIVGAGITGLTAAHDLLSVGHDVTIFEASDAAGGLARGFKDEKWSWPLEHFYHHLFQSDKEIIQLVEELGIRDKLFFPRPLSSVYFNRRIYPFDSVSAWFRYPAMNFWQTIRFGAVSALLRYTRFWRLLERTTADQWMRRWYGDKLYELTWKPLLINKFGQYYDQVNMAWMWARLYVRTFRLGYFEGGFQTFADALSNRVLQLNGHLRFNAAVANIESAPNGRVAVKTQRGEPEIFDQCLVTTSPQLLQQMAPALSSLDMEYAAQLASLKSIGAVVMVVALRWPVLKHTYWLNLPASSPDKLNNEIPFLALVEHTNYIENRHYGGEHIIYLGDYVPPEHPYFEMSQEELENLFLPELKRFNPNFNREWVRKTWVFRAKYAQPVPFVNQSKQIPDLRTPLPGLFFASMSQVYPWDRGTNFSVEIGRRAARLMQKEPNDSS